MRALREGSERFTYRIAQSEFERDPQGKGVLDALTKSGIPLKPLLYGRRTVTDGHPIRLLVVSGSLSQKGRTAAALRTATLAFLEEHAGATSIELNVARAGIELMDGRPLDGYGTATRDAVEQARDTSAFLIGSPMYRGGITGALKNYLDLVPPDYMRGKVAAIVATGASHHHYLGVTLSLEPVLKFFQMHLVPSHLYVANTDENQATTDRRAQELGHALAELVRTHLPTGPAIE